MHGYSTSRARSVTHILIYVTMLKIIIDMKALPVSHTHEPTNCLDTWDENVEHFYFELTIFFAVLHITPFMEYALHLFKHTRERYIYTHSIELKFNDFILFYTLMVIGWRHTWNLFLRPPLKSGQMTGLCYFVPFCIRCPFRVLFPFSFVWR